MAGGKKRSARSKFTTANFWELKLYIAGRTLRSNTAVANLNTICQEYLKGRYRITVIDLKQHPEIAFKKQIVATPTVIKELPLPLRKIIGDLSQKERVLAGLDLIPGPSGDVCDKW